MTKSGKKEKKTPPIKKKFKVTKKHVALGAAALISFIVWFGLQPVTGPIQFGICRTFAEMRLSYPETMQVTAMDQFQSTIRVFYTFSDPYGINRSQSISCSFTQDELGNMIIHKIKFNARPYDREDMIEAFNKTIPSIIAANPDLVYRPPPTEDLKSLKQD